MDGFRNYNSIYMSATQYKHTDVGNIDNMHTQYSNFGKVNPSPTFPLIT